MSLIERIEQAEGPSRELDAEIAVAVGFHGGNPVIAPGMDGWLVGSPDNPNPVRAPHYTSSIDEAKALAEGKRVILNIAEDGITTAIVGGTESCASHPALALAAAALKAKEANDGK